MPAEPGVLARPDREAVIPITVERRGLISRSTAAMIATTASTRKMSAWLSVLVFTCAKAEARWKWT